MGSYIRDMRWLTCVYAKNGASEVFCAASCVFVFAGGEIRIVKDETAVKSAPGGTKLYGCLRGMVGLERGRSASAPTARGSRVVLGRLATLRRGVGSS
ncbi:hypothetical protein FQZ97_307990 [compost metagenome]